MSHANTNSRRNSETWRDCRTVVLHSPEGRLTGELRNPYFIERLLDPDHFRFGIPWTPVVVRDELHLIHSIFTPCEGEA